MFSNVPWIVGFFFALVGATTGSTNAESLPPHSQASTTQAAGDLQDFRTVDTATTAQIQASLDPTPQTGYLGIAVGRNAAGKVMIQSVNPTSPAAAAGLKEGDVILRAGKEEVVRPESFQEWLLNHAPDQTIKLTILRDGKPSDISATLAPVSRPMKLGTRRVIIGATYRDATQGEGAAIDRVAPGMPSEKAGLHTGDVIVECDSIPITAAQSLVDALFGRNPGEIVKLMVKRGGKLDEVHVTLDAAPASGAAAATDRSTLFKKDVYHLALIGVEFPDVKHNEMISKKDWEAQLFSTGVYYTTNATRQPVFGSVNDYYHEDSAGAFRLEGSMFDWVSVSKARADYAVGTGDREKMLPEVLDSLLKRDGKDALNEFDGVAFIYAGERVPTTRGGLFWPHRGYMPYGGKRWSYLIVPEGAGKMTNISLFCHEFGHMLGLPDLYARPENPGSEGLGNWCLMSNQLPNGRPQHMSAWCKEQLGWLKPTIIDPTVQQKLVLSPVEGAGRECFKVLIRQDGSEYLLLENRHKTGFDTDLPGDGLLIWRVVGGRPFLQASHGIQGPAGPRSFLWEVPFPSVSNNSFTPYTTPSSRSLLGGGLLVFISQIERRPGGKVTFAIGYQYF